MASDGEERIIAPVSHSNRLTMPRVTLAFLVLCFAPGVAPAGDPAGKVIATGWDRPTPARWKKELPAFEKLGVFQGATIAATRRVSGGDASAYYAFTAEKWTWAEFAPAVADLKAAKSATVTETFLLIYANPGDVDWFDDDGWKQVIDHWRLLARAAREGGLRGVLFDAEPYTPPFQQFNYAAQSGRKKHTFAEYEAKARERGREVMKAVGEEFPGCVIMTYRLLCDLAPVAAADGDVTPHLAVSTFGLMPAFVDGWLDKLPPGVRIVEGNENAYRYNSRADFEHAYTQLRTDTPRLLSAENRVKYRAQVDIGHGIYIDAYANPPGDIWYIDPKGTAPSARLEANVADALRASDGWVWVNGESGRWWTGGNPKYPTWDGKLPGASAAIARAARPRAAAIAALDQKRAINLLANGSFAQADDQGRPTQWWTWQADKSQGRFALTKPGGAAEIRRALKGCFGQITPVKQGGTYAASVRVRHTGSGAATAWVRWKTSANHWIEGEDVALTPVGPVDANGWQRLVALARLPATAEKLALLLSADDQSDDGVAEFTDARLVECGSGR